MRFFPGIALLVALAGVVLHAPRATAGTHSPLDRPLFPAPLRFENVPLSDALGRIGAHVQTGYVLFGAEVRLENGKEPTVSLNLGPGSTVADALHELLLQLPHYSFKAVSSHLVEILPVGADRDLDDLLNLQVPRFDIVNVMAGDVLSRPQDFIPLLAERVTPPPKAGVYGGVVASILSEVGPPPISLHLRNVTLRGILNAVSEATETRPAKDAPLSWLYTFKPDANLPAGGEHMWSAFCTVPYNWKQQTNE